jgi:hypothetical protein
MESISMWIARDRSPRSRNRPRATASASDLAGAPLAILSKAILAKAILSAAALTLLVCPPPATAASATSAAHIEAVSAVGGPIEARAGSTLTLSFRVTNPSDSLSRYDEALDLPSGWIPIIPAESFTLEPRASGGRIFAVRIPQTAEPATYDLVYRVVGAGGLASLSEGKTTVRVRANATLLLTVDESPELYVGVGECRARLRLTNQGNVPLETSLHVDAEPQLRAECVPSSVRLSAGDDAVIDVTFQIPDHEIVPTHFAPRVKAEARMPDGTEVSSSATISFEAVPSRMAPDRYRRAPAILVLGAGGTGERIGTQAEVRGSTGNPHGTTVDFQFRPPAGAAMGPFAAREIYAVSVHDPTFEALVGDQTFGFSRLTEQSIYGRGASVAIRTPHGFEIGGCGMNSRTEPRAGREDWFFGSKQLRNRGSLTLGLMDRNSGKDGAIRDHIYNLTGKLRAGDLVSCAFECATSRRSSDTSEGETDVIDGVPVGARGGAYFLTADGSLPRGGLRYGLTKSHAASGFTGELRDGDRLDARVQGNPWRGGQAGICLDRRETNMSLSDPLSPGSRERLAVATLSQSLPHRVRVGIEGSLFREEDLRDIASPQEERVLGLTLDRSTARAAARAELRTGTILEPDADGRIHAWMFALHGTVRPTPETYLAAHYAGAARGKEPITRGRIFRDRGEIEIATGIDLDGKLELDLRGRSTQADVVPDALSLTGRWVLSNGSILSLQMATGNRLREATAKEAPFLVTWTVPFGIPVGRKAALDAVKGAVVDAEALGEPGIAGAIVRVDGVMGATGPDGRFTIRVPRGSAHIVTIDSGSLGIGRVLSAAMPLRVEGHGGASLRIGVVRAARIAGKIESIAQDGAKSAMQGAIVRITDGTETLRSVTDAEGRFAFSDLRPGAWTMTASPHGSSRDAAQEGASTIVHAAPGETARASLSIHERSREIRMIDSGDVKAAKPPQSR